MLFIPVMLETVAAMLSHESNSQRTEDGRTGRWEANVTETVSQPWVCLTLGFLDLPGSVLIALHTLTFPSSQKF